MKNRSLPVVLSLLLVANIVVQTLAWRNGAFSQLDLLVDVRHELLREFVDVPDEKKMAEAAVRAMVSSLGDPYTVYLAPEELAGFDKAVRGTFSGIGAEIDIHEKRLRIVTPLEGSPAWKAGVHAGDIVIEIDGKDTEGITTADAISQLTGKEGTPVTIKVRHLNGKEATITITRARIKVPTVKGVSKNDDNSWDFMLDRTNKIGYIRLTQFTDQSIKKLQAAMTKLSADGMKGLVLDLRFNPGGLLNSAVKVSDMFLDGGKTIVSVRGRSARDRSFSSTPNTPFKDLPLVVMINGSSASASEIVSGALKDNERARIIGTRSFGKGSVQQVKMLESGLGALKITNALYYLPSGRNIHRKDDSKTWGVDPDNGYYVDMTDDQTLKMLEIRRDPESDLKVPDDVNAAWIEKETHDMQLAAAIKTLQGKITNGKWSKVGGDGVAELTRAREIDRLRKLRESINERIAEIDKRIQKLGNGEDVEDEKEASKDADKDAKKEDDTKEDDAK